ncbi:MAG: CoA pyrophosphatase [Stagnimonas sp.]|nr:CoA pyrophosphatase [Stagnimonas sp.]
MSAARQEAGLRAALSGSHEHAPRPMVDLELPALVRKALLPSMALLKPAAVLVPLLRRDAGLSVLLTRRADTLRHHRGQISFPGGRRDPEDQSFADCALREAEEEVALPRAQVEVIGYLDDYPTVSRYLVTPVVALVQPPPAFRFDPGEVAEVFEIPLSAVLDRGRFQRGMLNRDGFRLPFLELQHESWRIWGATAGMLWDLSRKVNIHLAE